MGDYSNVVIAELVLIELYQLLRNPKVMSKELSGAEAVDVIDTFRNHPLWRIVENAPVMEHIWPIARKPDFARRKMFDLCLGYTLLHHGVTQFATANISDFKDVGFERLWNPLM